ncbi:amino acid ABC transporter [Romboutsia maritimum]|uniref:Amino acid ABC transporter n=1 Tax=Romboutsia maritimum TaxID=2020948 RepID=A0A371ITK2_9FIRM|nr:transporter substrate-binding domain-containing protein [Romboutsia maritimum]RDY23814.1 amino acid ABC transporter [Romboutsia maritimum]
MKKLKKSVLVMLVGVLSLGTVGCSSSKKDVNQLQAVKDKGVLTIGTSADYPPYEFHKEIDGKDTIVGFEMVMAQEIAKDLGVKLEIKDMKFDGLLGALKSGNIDMVVAGMSPTQERKKAVNFTDVYYNGEHTILIKGENKEKYKTVEDLKNSKIAVQKASLQESIAKDVIQSTDIKSLSKISDVVLELQNNNVDAIVVSKEAIIGYLNQYPQIIDTNIELGEDAVEGSAIAIDKSDDMSLLDAVNKALNKLEKESKIEKFVKIATELAQ